MSTWGALAVGLLVYLVYRITKHYAYREGFSAGEQAGLRASREVSHLVGLSKGWAAGYQQGRSEKIQKEENNALSGFPRCFGQVIDG